MFRIVYLTNPGRQRPGAAFVFLRRAAHRESKRRGRAATQDPTPSLALAPK